MKAWQKINDKYYGDALQTESSQAYGVIKQDDGYCFGGLNKEGEKEGFSIEVKKDFATFGKYENGEPTYPVVKIMNNGDIELDVRKKEEEIVKLVLNSKEGSFNYYRVDLKGQRQGFGFFYDGLTNGLHVNKHKDGVKIDEAELEKKFFVEAPLSYDKPLDYPKEISEFVFQQGANYVSSTCIKDCFGLGVLVFDNDDLCLGGFEDCGRRTGWEIYHTEENDFIFYADNAQFDGPVIQIKKDGEIYIFIENSDGDSSVIHLLVDDLDTLLYYNSTTEQISEGDPVIRLRCFSELSFSEYKKGGINEFKDYIYARDYLKKGEPVKEKPVDPTDPEYQMMSLIGQAAAKKEFTRIRAYIQKNNTFGSYTNIVFTGENGVGKSTVGRLISKVLYKYHAIANPGYLEVNARELFDSSTSLTTENLKNLLNKGSGGVILIDDLHYLDALNLSNIKEGLSALGKIMGENPSTVFILCDTKYNMTQIMENNRDIFQDKIRFHVDFVDFTREELEQIINLKLKNKGYLMTEEAMKKLLDVIFLSKSYGNNINASAALSILEEIIVIQNVRTELEDSKLITIDDVDVYTKENDIAFIDQKTGYQSDARKKLDELVGLEKIKETVDDLIAYFSINRGKRVDFHMAFTGNPGTGKTEVARIIGKLLRQEGILGTQKFLEVTRRDLVGQYIGQSAIMTRDIINKAMGGVLYIDEAYSLAYGGEKDYGPEVIAELLKAMEDRRGEFCVILAGYTSEMKKLFDLNPGFKSRIKFDLEFPDYTDEELEKIARLFLKRDNNVMSDEDIKFLVKLVSIQRNKPNFANVRTLREYISRLQIKHAGRVRSSNGKLDPNEMAMEDIKLAFSEEEIKEAMSEQQEEPVEKLNPQVLLDLQKDYQPISVRENKEYISEAILALKMQGDRCGEGTGFIITKEGHFLTCAHCTEGFDKIYARRRIHHHGHTVDINYEAKVISIDKKADIALCKLEADENEQFEYLVLAKKNEQLDKLNRVCLIGYPFGSSRFDEISIYEGSVASYQKESNHCLDQINLDIKGNGGNSGSPVINEGTSEVIGVFCGASLSFGTYVTEEINYASPIDKVYQLLENEYKGEK